MLEGPSMMTFVRPRFALKGLNLWVYIKGAVSPQQFTTLHKG